MFLNCYGLTFNTSQKQMVMGWSTISLLKGSFCDVKHMSCSLNITVVYKLHKVGRDILNSSEFSVSLIQIISTAFWLLYTSAVLFFKSVKKSDEILLNHFGFTEIFVSRRMRDHKCYLEKDDNK